MKLRARWDWCKQRWVWYLAPEAGITKPLYSIDDDKLRKVAELSRKRAREIKLMEDS